MELEPTIARGGPLTVQRTPPMRRGGLGGLLVRPQPRLKRETALVPVGVAGAEPDQEVALGLTGSGTATAPRHPVRPLVRRP